MRVRLLKKETVNDFAIKNARSTPSFKLWIAKLKIADWETPDDIINTFPSTDILGNGSSRVVFNIGGNNYRMICSYWFSAKKVWLYVKWIGTHTQYDKLCKKNKQYIIDDYK